MVRSTLVVVALAAVLTGCTGAAPEEGPAEEPAATATPTPSASEPSAEPTTPSDGSEAPEPSDGAWPPASTTIAHGSQVWGAYVAVTSSPEDPAVAAASERLEEVGYASGFGAGELGCDEGATEALGAPEGSYGLAVYFDTQADAETFAELWGPELVGTAQVTLFCMD